MKNISDYEVGFRFHTKNLTNFNLGAIMGQNGLPVHLKEAKVITFHDLDGLSLLDVYCIPGSGKARVARLLKFLNNYWVGDISDFLY